MTASSLARRGRSTVPRGLRYVTDGVRGIMRKRVGTGWAYYAPGGERIIARDARARINRLAIPPAWTRVWICPDPNGHIQATGRDDRGRSAGRRFDPACGVGGRRRRTGDGFDPGGGIHGGPGRRARRLRPRPGGAGAGRHANRRREGRRRGDGHGRLGRRGGMTPAVRRGSATPPAQPSLDRSPSRSSVNLVPLGTDPHIRDETPSRVGQSPSMC